MTVVVRPKSDIVLQRTIDKIVDVVPEGRLTIEGTPLYFGEEWSAGHEYGMNQLLPIIFSRLHETEHFVLVDDYTGSREGDEHEFLERLSVQPKSVRYESEFADEAVEWITLFHDRGRTRFYRGHLVLSSPNEPALRTRSGRPSCALLDALYQTQKGEGYHIIIHPKSFRRQQREMQDVQLEMHDGRLPCEYLRIFYTPRLAISTVEHTDREGNTRRL